MACFSRPHMKTLLSAALLCAAVLSSSSATACPLCNTATGAEVRALAFGPDFLRLLGVTLAPAPILLALVAGTGFLERSTTTRERAPDAA